MKHLAIFLCAASALLSGCAAEAEYWYQRKANAPDFDVVKAKCRRRRLRQPQELTARWSVRNPRLPSSTLNPEANLLQQNSKANTLRRLAELAHAAMCVCARKMRRGRRWALHA